MGTDNWDLYALLHYAQIYEQVHKDKGIIKEK